MWSPWAWVSAMRKTGAPSVLAVARMGFAPPQSIVSTRVSPSSSGTR